MEFKFSFDWNKKKSINSLTNTAAPELWGNSIFYPLQHTTQNNQALINMYNELPEISAPVNYIIDTISILPFKHVTKRGDTEIEVEGSRFMDLLEHPNGYQTENDFIKNWFLNRIVLGVGYVNYLRSIGMPGAGELFVLPSENTKPVLQSTSKDYRLNQIIGFETSFGGHIIELTKDEVYYNKESTIGNESLFNTRSRLMAAILTSDNLRANYEARLALLNDRGSVGIISPNENGAVISAQDAKSMREKYYQENGITKGRFPYMISPRGLNFTSTSMNAGELELLPNKTQDFQIVCNILGLDPALFGLGNNTYNNKKLAKTAFYEDVAIPYHQNYLQFMGKVVGLPEGDYFKGDYSQIAAMQEDFDKVVQSNSKAWNDGIITEAEYREAIGREGGEDRKKEVRESNSNPQSPNSQQ